MKLSTLVNYRNEFRKLNLHPMKKGVEDDLGKVLHLVSHHPVAENKFLQHLQNQEQHIYGAIDQFQVLVDGLANDLDKLINEIEPPYFLDSYKLYENDFQNETLDDLIDRQPKLCDSTVEYYCARLSRYNTWHYPAMIVRPGVESYINNMLACDPLYLVDLRHELLVPAVQQYNEVYQQRLRTYVVNERDDQILHRLPDSQFGVILVYNYFNFRPFEVIKKWLTELLAKLKPGGVLLMTFNDCDNNKAVMLVEQRYCCYTPGHLIMQLAQTLGYEIVFKWSDGNPSTWVELQRPGTISSVRGGQALAKIIPKLIAKSK